MSDRIEDLEIKIAFVEKAVADLDEVVRALGAKVDEMQQDLRDMKAELSNVGGGGQVDLVGEKPPHY